MPRPKGLPRTGGRKVGTPNKATLEIREAARQIVESEQGRKKMLELYNIGELHPALVQMLHHYAYGKPKERVEHSGPDGRPIETAVAGQLNVTHELSNIRGPASELIASIARESDTRSRDISPNGHSESLDSSGQETAATSSRFSPP